MPKRSIQDIKSERAPRIAPVRPGSVVKRLHSTPSSKPSMMTVRKPLRMTLYLAILSLAIYSALVVFTQVHIRVIPRADTFTLANDSFVASKDSSSPLHFEVMIVSDSQKKDIILTQSQDVSLKAKGTLTLYNEYTTKPQAIKTQARMSDESGRSYVLSSAVTIPGYTTVDGVLVPGTIEAQIEAFLPGDSYNATPTDFTFTTFKGTTKAKKLYGKAKTPVMGGAQGLVYTLDPEQKGVVNAYATSNFKANLIKKVNAQVPKGYILYPDAVSFSYTTESESTFSDPEASVAVNGTLSAVIFKQDELSRLLIKHFLPDIPPSTLGEIDLTTLSSLSFSTNVFSNGIVKDIQTVPFSFTGTLATVWHPDVNMLVKNLINTPKENIGGILQADPGVASFTYKIFPPWQRYLPSVGSKIHIMVK